VVRKTLKRVKRTKFKESQEISFPGKELATQSFPTVSFITELSRMKSGLEALSRSE